MLPGGHTRAYARAHTHTHLPLGITRAQHKAVRTHINPRSGGAWAHTLNTRDTQAGVKNTRGTVHSETATFVCWLKPQGSLVFNQGAKAHACSALGVCRVRIRGAAHQLQRSRASQSIQGTAENQQGLQAFNLQKHWPHAALGVCCAR